MNTFIPETPRPVWDQLSAAIQAEWIKSLENFYPEGTITKDDLDGMAKYEYQMAETLHPERTAAD